MRDTLQQGLPRSGCWAIYRKAKIFMSEENTPVFQIQRVYLKEASLEQPNSPGILLSQETPSVLCRPTLLLKVSTKSA